ncbi:hypothetical protein [Owenweeksia hongkongensis]|uniref:hypothetical protein n=1 Tax=Owenweeksia hongkongensis TaxID=253245 RepID=UPI003A90B8C8
MSEIIRVQKLGKYFTLSLLLSVEIGLAQQSCLGLRNDTLIAFKVPKEQMFDAINEDVEIVANCLELDSVDRFILTTPVLTTLIAGQALNGEELVYGSLFDSIEKMRNSSEYSEMKAVTAFMIENESKPLSKEGWERLEPMLAKMLDNEEMLTKVKRQFDSSIGEGMSYREFFTYVFTNESAEEETPKNELTSPFDIFYEMEPLEAMLEKSAVNQKPLLLYFSGWGCVNGRKMEESWHDEGVFALMENNFIAFMGYADDRAAMTDELRKKWKVGDEVKTMGKCIDNFQKEFLNSNSQPFFAIVSPDGKVIATQGYTLDTDAFKSFLNTKVD